MYEALEQGKVTKKQLLQTLDEMLFANIDVTMGGLSWLLVFLAAHPALQQTLRDEIRTQSATPSACHDYLVSSRTVAPDLLGACILESARLRPFAAFSIPQACPTPRVLDGFEIPAGTNYIVDSYALNVRDPFWGTDREHFKPQRWQERHARGLDLRYRYWRFGFGPRTCLGKNLTDLILRSVAVEMLSNWHLSLQDTSEVGGKVREQGTDGIVKENMELPWDHESWIHQPDSLLVCRPLMNEGEGLSRIGLDEPAI